MDKKDLQLFAGRVVVESKISKPAKLQLLNWLQNEATEAQIKSMLLDGEPFAKLDEQSIEIVNKRFEKSKVFAFADSFAGYTVLPTNVVGIGGAVLGAFIIANAAKGIRILLSSKECKDFRPGTPGHRKCELNVKIKNEQLKLKAIQSKMPLCAKSKDPVKCKAKVKTKIDEINDKISRLKSRMQ